jgi:membrane-associated protease RseP (regulator of RpoE activity)
MLRLSIARIPIAVHWSFVLIGFLAIGQMEIAEVVGFVVGVFVAVLSHEMGHALTARRFGAKSVNITLFGLGGLTQYPADTPLTPGRRFLIAASGSAVGMTLGGLLYLGRNTDVALDLFPFGRAVIWGTVVAGLFWGALNWLPILPLDGGNMTWHALEIVTPTYALRIAKSLTVITAAVVAYLAITLWDNTFGAVFLAVIASQGLRIPERNATARPRPRPTPADEESLLSIFDDGPEA